MRILSNSTPSLLSLKKMVTEASTVVVFYCFFLDAWGFIFAILDTCPNIYWFLYFGWRSNLFGACFTLFVACFTLFVACFTLFGV